MNCTLAALASASCSLRYCVADDTTVWWLFAATIMLVYAWHHRDS